MNVVKLNTISLDGDTFIKKGGSSTAKPKYTGHADVAGLKAIGWDDEDIAYYQQHCVNWNEEEDMYHKVSEDNKALYGVLTVDNISTYKGRIVYLPKIDTSALTSAKSLLKGCRCLLAIPKLDTSNVTDMTDMFHSCYALTSIPELDTSKVKNMSGMFHYCYALTSIPELDTSSVIIMSGMFYYCHALTSIPELDTSNVTNMSSMFNQCHSLTSIPKLDTSNVTDVGYMFAQCYKLTEVPPFNIPVTSVSNFIQSTNSLTHIHYIDVKYMGASQLVLTSHLCLCKVFLKNLHFNIGITSPSLSKDSVLYIINNEAATSPITLTLLSVVYDTLINDEEIIAALEAHPNVSLAK